jgi:hypothetical protein
MATIGPGWVKENNVWHWVVIYRRAAISSNPNDPGYAAAWSRPPCCRVCPFDVRGRRDFSSAPQAPPENWWRRILRRERVCQHCAVAATDAALTDSPDP